MSPSEDNPCHPCDCDPLGSLSSVCIKDDHHSDLHGGEYLIHCCACLEWFVCVCVEGLCQVRLVPLCGNLVIGFSTDSLARQIFIECLLCVRQFSRTWKHTLSQDDQGPCS